MKDSTRPIPVTTTKSRERLTRTRLTAYREHREEFIHWLKHEVVYNNEQNQGYAHETVRTTAANTDLFNRWVWDMENRFVKFPKTVHGDQYLQHVRSRDLSDTQKSAKEKALKRYFNWRDADWEPKIHFTGDDGRGNTQDYFTRSERKALRDASHDLGSVPAFEGLNSEERSEWKRVLANRFRMPQSEIGAKEFRQANGYKWPSLVNMALDAGMRPIEVNRARVGWVDAANKRLLIPKEESSKGSENWEVGLRSETATLLEHWKDEREQYGKYDSNDRLWLTREGNPYNSRTLNYWLDKLMNQAGITDGTRNLTWYAMRHSTGTYVAADEDIEQAAAQLRHKRLETTRRYNHTPAEELSKTVENIE
jgi:integrase